MLREFVSVSIAQSPVFFIRLITLSKSFDLLDPQSIIDVYIRLSNNILAKHLIGYKIPFIYKEQENIEPFSINELTKSALAIDNKINVSIDGSLTTNELIS